MARSEFIRSMATLTIVISSYFQVGLENNGI